MKRQTSGKRGQGHGRTGAAWAWLAVGALGCTPLPQSLAEAERTKADLRMNVVDMARPPDGAMATGRNWTTEPAVVQLDTLDDIYALGDIHADYDRLVTLLVKNKLLVAAPTDPAGAQWAGGHAVLVVTGDVIDKDDHALKALALLQALRDGAAAVGGRVIVTLGNHEAEFLADPTSSKVADFVAELSAAGISAADVAAGRHPLGVYLRGLPVAARVRDWFFCHAGNTAGRTMAKLIADIQTGVDLQGFGTPALSADDSLLEARLDPAPWWELAGDPKANLVQYATALGVGHLVMGHQPSKYTFADGAVRSKGQLFQRYGVLFLIDAGMSHGVDYSKGALLRIKTAGAQTTATALAADGSATELWKG